MGRGGTVLSFMTSVIDGDKLLASRSSRFTTGERAPSAHWLGGWVGPVTGLDAMEKRNMFPYKETNPGHPVAGPSLYDWAIPNQQRKRVRNKEIWGNAKNEENKTNTESHNYCTVYKQKSKPNRHDIMTSAPSCIEISVARLRTGERATQSTELSSPCQFLHAESRASRWSTLTHSPASTRYLKRGPSCQNTYNARPEKDCFHRVPSLIEQSWNFQLEHTF
jgi:hypothetical protein